MKGLVVRTCLLIDFMFAIPVFAALIMVDPRKYADTLAQSGETIRRKIREYSGVESEALPLQRKRVQHGR